MSEKPKEKSGDARAQDLIRKMRHKAGYRGKDVEPLSTREKKVVKEDLGTGLKLAYDIATHPLTPIAIRAIKKKFRKKKKVEETTKTKGEIRQGIANKHFNLILKGKKDSASAQKLKDAYRQREDTTVPRKKWNPIPKFQDVTRGIDKGYVNPRGGDMTTIDPRSKLPMMVVKKKARGELNKRKRKSNPGSNEGLGQDPEI